jgi:hypothetical protein
MGGEIKLTWLCSGPPCTVGAKGHETQDEALECYNLERKDFKNKIGFTNTATDTTDTTDS